jgi:hypothetical protein
MVILFEKSKKVLFYVKHDDFFPLVFSFHLSFELKVNCIKHLTCFCFIHMVFLAPKLETINLFFVFWLFCAFVVIDYSSDLIFVL